MNNKGSIPNGMRDLVFKECDIRRKIKNSLEDTFKSFGYDEIITPSIEYYKTFSRDSDNLKEEVVYKFFDENGRILILRPDMTIPIARVVGTKMKEVDAPIRLTYTSNIFRVNKTFGGKRNEYIDCGVELIGCKDECGDLEIIVTALEALKSIAIKKFKIEIGNINFFNNAFDAIGINKEDKEKLANLIEEKSLIELISYLDYLKLDKKYKEFFIRLPWLFGDESALNEGINLAFNDEIKNSLLYIKSLYEKLKILGYTEYVTFDLGMVPRVNYYTGIIFKGYIEGASSSILNGGRYDNLIKAFGRDIEAVGFSINIDAICENIGETNKENNEIVIHYGKNRIIDAIKKGNELRDKNFRVKIIEMKDDNLFKVYGGE